MSAPSGRSVRSGWLKTPKAVASVLLVAVASCQFPHQVVAFGGSPGTVRTRGPLRVPESTALTNRLGRHDVHLESRRQSPAGIGRRETRLQMSSMPRANLAIRLDEPLLSPTHYRRPTTVAMLKYILGVFLSDAFKFALVAFLLAFAASLLARSQPTSLPKTIFSRVASGVSSFYRWASAPFLRLADKVVTESAAVATGPPVPMTFDGEGGWGVCAYLGGEPVGRSGYYRYDFALPNKDNILPLSLGQHIALCCLDDKDNVVQGEFFPYSARTERGKFSILAPGGTNPERDEAELGIDRANFVQVLKSELDVGDEIALKPGGSSLEYRGQYLPVKEMVFVSSGEGIVPVLEQIRAVLPEGSSSVKLVSVVWLSKNTKDFDIADTELEAEYRKYPSKLAVTCVDDDVRDSEIEDNADIVESVPNFIPGTMAVVSGPRAFRIKARKYLMDRGYPSDCICVLT